METTRAAGSLTLRKCDHRPSLKSAVQDEEAQLLFRAGFQINAGAPPPQQPAAATDRPFMLNIGMFIKRLHI